MPLQRYGVLKGFAADRRIGAGNGKYHIRVMTDSESFRVSVNSKSSPDSLLCYHTSADFAHPLTQFLHELPLGFTPVLHTPGGSALDYTRGNLVNKDLMVTIPGGLLGGHSTMNEVLDHMILPAMSEDASVVCVFGTCWGPEPRLDRPFGFVPSSGMHNVHMNQGGVGRFTTENGVFQDGGLFLYHSDVERWQAIFLAFGSQTWATDDATGHPRLTSPRTVRIASALVNPVGEDSGKETVTLANRTGARIDLRGWSLANTTQQRHLLDGMRLEPHATVHITLPSGICQLSNRGGLITLSDPSGAKVDGVSYTRTQASVEGVELIWPESQPEEKARAAPEAGRDYVFVAYARANSDFAMTLAQALKDRGFLVWIDQWSIPAGADWDRSIDAGIQQAPLFIVVLSKNAIQSNQVLSELQFALDTGKTIFPVLMEDCEIPRILRRVQHVDFRQFREDGEKPLQELIRSMRQVPASLLPNDVLDRPSLIR